MTITSVQSWGYEQQYYGKRLYIDSGKLLQAALELLSVNRLHDLAIFVAE